MIPVFLNRRTEDNAMARGEQRSNKEKKKPKAAKPAAAPVTSSFSAKSITAPINNPKKKG
jgi:hypothetical protein